MEFQGFVCSDLESCVTKFAPHQVLKLIARGKLTFGERVVLRRVVGFPNCPLGSFGSFDVHHMQTLERVLLRDI